VEATIGYARSGDVNIAYQVTGEGAFDLVLVSGFVSHLDYDWQHPSSTRLLERLGSFARLIRFDKRVPVFPIAPLGCLTSRREWTTCVP
jgi:hypothetical protein